MLAEAKPVDVRIEQVADEVARQFTRPQAAQLPKRSVQKFSQRPPATLFLSLRSGTGYRRRDQRDPTTVKRRKSRTVRNVGQHNIRISGVQLPDGVMEAVGHSE